MIVGILEIHWNGGVEKTIGQLLNSRKQIQLLHNNHLESDEEWVLLFVRRVCIWFDST